MSPRAAKSWAGVSSADLKGRWGRDSIFLYGALESTNDTARELAEAGKPSGTVVLCREQTAGRGREGRDWASPSEGGLYLSMLFRPSTEAISPLVTIVAGVDVALELNHRFPGVAAGIKWPNDVMAQDRKLGGILVEASPAPDGAHALVVGIGLNVRAARLPKGLDAAVALDECVEGVDLVSVADAAIAALERRVPASPASLGEAELDEVDRLDWLKNRRIEHRLGENEPAIGVAAGIAPDGALLLRPDRGALRRVVAGSVDVADGARPTDGPRGLS